MRHRLRITLRPLLVATALGGLGVAVLGLSQLDARAGILVGAGTAAAVLSTLLVRVLSARHDEPVTRDSLTGLQTRGQLLKDLRAAARSSQAGHPKMLVLIDLLGFKEYNDTFGRPAGDALLLRLAHSLARGVVARGTAYRLDGDEFAALITVERDAAMLAEFVVATMEESGDGFSIVPRHGLAVVPLEAHSPEEAMRVANERLYALKYCLQRTSRSWATEDALMNALDRRSSEYGDWARGLTEIVEAVARRLDLPQEEVEQLQIAATLHDVGKSALPRTILEKRFPLDSEERAFVQRHPLIGERIMHAAPALARMARLVRWTHERYDGGGYPDHLRGSEIPLGARIIAVCDAFDAMISARPYRPPLSSESAIAELRRCAGTQFDPGVVAAFCAVMDERSRFFAAA
ncbi:MAG: HD-GYP domain-containing protein [Gaiellaceae bacterium]